ncbi:MAG: PD-(D/E)XK nuclease family protein, partial [Actinomycetota bacterium]
LWPSHSPYARLVEHHLTADGVPWNGRGGIEVSERIAPRLLLDLLDVDRRRFRRSDLFDLLADVPARDESGRRRPTAEWQRVARAAGISEDPDWRRLASYDERSRWADAADELLAFVDDLRERLGRPDATRTWREWAEWCDTQLVDWLGPRAEIRLSDPEYRAWEALMATLDRLRSLDHVVGPATRHHFRAVLRSELDDVSVREGRIGTGVVAGSLVSAPGLDLDVAIVLGGVDGVMPPAPRTDPLLSDDDRRAAGLADADERGDLLHHAFRAVLDACHTVVTAPRGDLRTTTEHQLTRWLEPLVDRGGATGSDLTAGLSVEHIDSAAAGLEALHAPPSERERRLRDRLRAGVPADPVAAAGLGDHVLARAIAMRAGRDAPTLSEYDGDLTSTEVGAIGERPVSPTRIQAWATCPHAYFNQYLLEVRPIEEVDRDISIRALDSGTLQHEVLDRLHRDVLEHRLPQPRAGWSDEHRAAMLTHFDDVCEETERRGRTGRPATWHGERARLRSELVFWMRHDGDLAAARGVEIVASEYDFGKIPRDDGVERLDAWEPVRLRLGDGRSIAVLGSADRIDRWADGTVVVTDHKTGRDVYTKLTAEDPTLEGTVFQLPAYAAAASALVGDATAVRAEYSMFGKGDYARRGFTFTDAVWERVTADLTEIIDGIEAGWFPQLPERPGWRLFVRCAHCDPDGIGTDDAWARWTLKHNDERSRRWFGDVDTDDAGRGAAS